MTRLGIRPRVIAVAGLALVGALAGAAGWTVLTRPEAVLGWSFERGIRSVAADWTPAPSGPVLLDTIERAGGHREPTPVSLAPVPAGPTVLASPVGRLAAGDFISVGTTGGKVAVLEIVDVRPLDPAQLGMTAKPGAPRLLMVVCRDAEQPDQPEVRILLEAGPETAPGPTRS